MVVPEAQLGEAMTITELAFERAPVGGSSVLLHGFKIALTEGGGSELGRNFAGNILEDSPFTVVFSGSRVTAADDGEGRVSFVLDTPYEYTGGNLLIDMSYTNIEGSMYVWGWNPDGYRFLTASSSNSTEGNVAMLTPVVVVTCE